MIFINDYKWSAAVAMGLVSVQRARFVSGIMK